MSASERLQIQVDHSGVDDGVVVVSLQGELDPMTSSHLERELLATIFTGAPKELVLDFAGVTFMDSSGIRVLISVLHRQRDNGARLVLANVPATPARVLEVSGLTDEFELR